MEFIAIHFSNGHIFYSLIKSKITNNRNKLQM